MNKTRDAVLTGISIVPSLKYGPATINVLVAIEEDILDWQAKWWL
jgi:hypothetical protein